MAEAPLVSPYKHGQRVCLIERLHSWVSVGQGDVTATAAMGYFDSLEELSVLCLAGLWSRITMVQV